MIKVHHLNDSRSHRTLWLLEELGVDYEIVHHTRGPDMRAPSSLGTVHPLGKAPLVVLGGDTYAESGALVETLIDRFDDGRLRPSEGEDRARYRFYLHFAEGSFMPPLLVKLLMQKLTEAPVPFFVRPLLKGVAGKVDENYTDGEIRKNFGFVNDELASREWLAGEFSGADIMMSFPLEAARTRIDLNGYSHVRNYITRFQSRPAYLRALERGGSYRYGPPISAHD